MAEDVHGRKGMCKPRREKGPSRRKLKADPKGSGESPPTKDDWQMIHVMSFQRYYYQPGMPFAAISKELNLSSYGNRQPILFSSLCVTRRVMSASFQLTHPLNTSKDGRFF